MMHFHIPDFQRNIRLNLFLLDYRKEHPEMFWDDLVIDTVFDSFPLIWNGGRIVLGEFSAEIAEKTVQELNSKGVKCAFTFTNCLLEEKHLQDEDCNTLMQLAKGNTVIVNSPLLEKYIRENYPEYEIVLSTTRQLTSVEDVNKALGQDYELVVLDYNMNHDWEALAQITDKARCELLVNACCKENCPQRGEHYVYISERQLDLHNQEIPEKPNKVDKWNCLQGRYEYFQYKHFKNFISIEEIRETFMPMGFCHFKLEGRGSNALHLIEQYAQYLAKPEYRDELRYRMIVNGLTNRYL